MHLSEAIWIAIITSVPTIVAILVGPIFAVWYTRDGDRRRAEEERRMNIFRALMRTRRSRLHQDHVSSLNLVEIEFYGEKEVQQAFDDYSGHLRKSMLKASSDEVKKHLQEQDQLLAKLLHAMAKTLKFNKLEQIDIMNGGYTPQGWTDVEAELTILRRALIEVFKGDRALPMTTVTNPMPSSPYPPPPAIDSTEPKILEVKKDIPTQIVEAQKQT